MQAVLRAGLTGAAIASMSLGAGTAYATPAGPGVTGTVISKMTVGNTDYILREITIPPGQSTGWHYHNGPLYGFVKQGTLSHFDATCKQDGAFKSGSTVREPPGANRVHIGSNLGTEPLTLEVLYVLPHGAPLAQDAANPGCDFQ
ncbi:cupin domain-containing protein [Streptomyces nigrescens]|uniref:Cupin domain-containing protein n=1 Tax=Streptomyces nigrescens TaxID=1920 RepID=A0ABY7JED0_STRNI|nr:cupin domain-containing protein [Streptomyces nigrescens]WAU09533.1 cupin domain-containing protein [Streptomyces nigrescens]